MKKNLLGIICLISASICIQNAYAEPVGGEAAGNGQTRITETGPLNGVMTVYPTSDGQRIKNADGKEIRASGLLNNPAASPGYGTRTFFFPSKYKTPGGVKDVTDFQQETKPVGDPVDPGILYAGALDNGTILPLNDWLASNGYVREKGIIIPDFLPVGFDELYYAVDLSALKNNGGSFISNNQLGKIFTIDATGQLSDLPMYIFSSSPIEFTPGTGWTGTLLPAGTQVQEIGFHDVSSIPEPATLLLCCFGLMPMYLMMKRRGNNQ